MRIWPTWFFDRHASLTDILDTKEKQLVSAPVASLAIRSPLNELLNTCTYITDLFYSEIGSRTLTNHFNHIYHGFPIDVPQPLSNDHWSILL